MRDLFDDEQAERFITSIKLDIEDYIAIIVMVKVRQLVTHHNQPTHHLLYLQAAQMC